MLYCQKHSVWAYKSHKCNIHSLIPMSKECRAIANTMYHHLGIELLSAGCFVVPVAETYFDYFITFSLELRHELPPAIFDLPEGWYYYDEIVGTSLKISAIGYTETYTWTNTQSPSERCQSIAESFSMYLTSTYDSDGLKAVITLFNT